MLKSLGSVLAAAAAAGIVVYGMGAGTPARAQARGRVTFAARSAIDLRDWGQQLESMARSGELRTRQQRADLLVAGRTHERADQYYRGVRVFGGNVSRQYESSGLLVSAFGTVYDDIAIDPAPALDAPEASRIVAERAGLGLPTAEPELVVLPRDDGRYTLTWRVRALTTGDLRQYFVDAATGSIVLDYSDLQTQTATIGKGTGVLGDTKKISVTLSQGFTTTDRKRPPAIITYDMQGNFTRSLNIIGGIVSPSAADIARDSDNVWTDGSVVDAHVYAGYVYDYFFRRFNRHGLDNADITIRSLVNPARQSDANALFSAFPDLFVNAAYLGGGLMFYGVGLPPGQTFNGRSWDFMAGALDIVGHELTHAVTDYSSGLIYRNESGALNEAFSDIMGTAVEFFYQPPGSGRLQADYLCGEDVVTPNGVRSMSDPLSMGQPDNYSRRVLTSADNGGVHINSGIANNAFYLAIEGGTNRTSGLAVQGVGAANREQIERVFYRAFTQLMPANATFATARAATIQASVDLFGATSAANRAVTQAWTAVGVN